MQLADGVNVGSFGTWALQALVLFVVYDLRSRIVRLEDRIFRRDKDKE